MTVSIFFIVLIDSLYACIVSVLRLTSHQVKCRCAYYARWTIQMEYYLPFYVRHPFCHRVKMYQQRRISAPKDFFMFHLPRCERRRRLHRIVFEYGVLSAGWMKNGRAGRVNQKRVKTVFLISAFMTLARDLCVCVCVVCCQCVNERWRTLDAKRCG